jgi:hypothetical protein
MLGVSCLLVTELPKRFGVIGLYHYKEILILLIPVLLLLFS